MLSYLLATVLGLAPVLQAVFDLPLQLAFQRAALLGALAWLLLRARGPGLPGRDALKALTPAAAACALTLLALLLSPFRGYGFNEWGNYAAGLLVFALGSFLRGEERARVETGVLAGAWLVFAAALLQVFVFRNFLDKTPLTNLNALALYAVMIAPLALGRRRGWPLAAAMLVLVVWTESAGAALAALAAAGYYAVTRPGPRQLRENAWPLLGLAALAAAVFWLLQGDSLAGRLAWWRGALAMAAERPLAGFGFASYTWAQAAFQPAGAFREHAAYAHNYYLEFLAENGLPAALAWFWAVFAAFRRKEGPGKYALAAALAHSLVDFGLSVPANFWLFCWLLSSPAGGEPAPAPMRPSAGRLAALLALPLAALLSLDLRSLSFERSRARAWAAVSERGDFAAAEAALRPALSGVFRLPALELLGALAAADRRGPPGFRAAVYYETALLENPYSAGAWSALRRIYSAPGREAAAAGLERRRREVFE